MNFFTPIFLLFLLLLASPEPIYAAPFLDLDQSPSGMGVANAFVADASDASAMFYNPAGIAWQSGLQVMGVGAFITQDASVKLEDGISQSNSGMGSSRYGFTLGWQPHDRDWGVGLSYSEPYQVANTWGDDVFLGKASTTHLLARRISADIIYTWNSDLAISVGVDGYDATLDIDGIDTAFSGADRASFGGHFSLKWQPTFNWSLGAMYRSGSSIDFEADSGMSRVQLQLPAELRLGVGYRWLDNLRFEVDGLWIGSAKTTNLNVISLSAPENHPLDFKNSLALMAGITWTWRERSQFRFGYAWEPSVSDDAGFSARVPDAATHRVTLGAGGDFYGMHIDLAYAFSYVTPRTVVGSSGFDGEYQDMRHHFLFSGSKTF
ncbi:MAG: hypothetical protein R8M38_07650 [Mariprofundaceae bacterium]